MKENVEHELCRRFNEYLSRVKRHIAEGHSVDEAIALEEEEPPRRAIIEIRLFSRVLSKTESAAAPCRVDFEPFYRNEVTEINQTARKLAELRKRQAELRKRQAELQKESKQFDRWNRLAIILAVVGMAVAIGNLSYSLLK